MEEVDGGKDERSQHGCFAESEHCCDSQDRWSVAPRVYIGGHGPLVYGVVEAELG